MCVCVCVCVCVSWGAGLGWVELRVGSNIFSLYIAASHTARALYILCIYYTLLVDILICNTFLKLRK